MKLSQDDWFTGLVLLIVVVVILFVGHTLWHAIPRLDPIWRPYTIDSDTGEVHF